MWLRWKNMTTIAAVKNLLLPPMPLAMTPSPSRPRVTTTSSVASLATALLARRWTSKSPPVLPLPPPPLPRLLPSLLLLPPLPVVVLVAVVVVLVEVSPPRELPLELVLVQELLPGALLFFLLCFHSRLYMVALFGIISWVIRRNKIDCFDNKRYAWHLISRNENLSRVALLFAYQSKISIVGDGQLELWISNEDDHKY